MPKIEIEYVDMDIPEIENQTALGTITAQSLIFEAPIVVEYEIYTAVAEETVATC